MINPNEAGNPIELRIELAQGFAESLGDRIFNSLQDQLAIAENAAHDLGGKIYDDVYSSLDNADKLKDALHRQVKKHIDYEISLAEALTNELGNGTNTLPAIVAAASSGLEAVGGDAGFSSPAPLGPSAPGPSGDFQPQPDQACPAEHGLYVQLRCTLEGSYIPVCSCLYDAEGPPIPTFGDVEKIIGPFSSMNECLAESSKWFGRSCGKKEDEPASDCPKPDLSLLGDCLLSCTVSISPPPKAGEHLLTGVKCCPDGSIVTYNCRVRGIPHVSSLDLSWCWWVDNVPHYGMGPMCPKTPKEYIDQCYKEPFCGLVQDEKDDEDKDGDERNDKKDNEKDVGESISCWWTMENCPMVEDKPLTFDVGCPTDECITDQMGELL